MGCIYAKPVTIDDIRESPSVPLADPTPWISPEKLSAAMVERKHGRRAVRSSYRDEDMGERDVYSRDKQLRMILSIPMAVGREQVAAGWPAWLVAVAGEAIRGWIPRRADSFEKLDKIGQGTYSSVYRARDLENGKFVALKKVRFDCAEPESVRFMAREIRILRILDHPNVVKLLGLVTSHLSCSLYLVLEYMEHDLTGLASHPAIKLTEPQVKCYMKQLLHGLDYCHGRGILHRDIKGSNLLIDNNGGLKIADFGLARFSDPEERRQLTSRVVTLWYRPPELLLGATKYDGAVDLWSAGCILAELYAGKPIMPGRTEVEQLHKIFKLCGSPSEDYWMRSKLPHATIFKPQQPYRRLISETYESFPAPALSFIEVLLSIDPAGRGSTVSALKNEYFTTKPLPSVPSTLPKYPPSKELDAKLREEDARRQRAAQGKPSGLERGGEPPVVFAPDANAELSLLIKKCKIQSNPKSRNEKLESKRDEIIKRISIELPKPARVLKAAELSHGHYRKSFHSGPLINRIKDANASKFATVARRNAYASQLVNEQFESHMNQHHLPSFAPKGNRIDYSGPLPGRPTEKRRPDA